jgi:thioredoxin 1
MGENTVKVTDSSFQDDVLNSEVPVLVDFWAPWCGPCRMVGPILEELAEDYEGKIKIAKVNVDEETQIAGSMGIRSIPTLVIFKEGKAVNTVIGAQPKDKLKKMIDELT